MTQIAGRARAVGFVATFLVPGAVALVTIAEAPSALAQDAQTTAPKKPKKKKPKPAAPPADAPADVAPAAPAPEPAPPPEPAPTPAPPPAETTAPAAEAKPPAEELAPMSDVFEKPAETYHFVGLRYRGTIIPKFMMNLFVDEGSTMYSNSIGIELDIRRDGFSMIPNLSFMSLGFGDTLFRQKGTADVEYNYSDVSSQLNGIFLGADVLWSKEISKSVAFEYGAGIGIGAIFGTLTNDWVYTDPNGPLHGSNGQSYSPCATTNNVQNGGCNPGSHTNPPPGGKVNNYHEPNWLQSGSIPVVFPQISLPILGVRYKPIKIIEARLQIGFSLTGPFFALSADYGLESRKLDPKGTGGSSSGSH